MSDKNVENELRLTNAELNRRIALLEETLLEKKKTEAESKQLMAAIEQAGEAIVITDAQGIIQFVNSVFERTTGYSRKEAIGQNLDILNSGEQDELFYRDLWNTISSGRIWVGRMVNKRKDGTLYTEGMTISPVFDTSGRIVNYISIKRNITENLRLAAQYQQSQKMEAVGRLADGVAHDFNNMLGVIIGYTELVLSKIEPIQPVRAYLEEILKAARRSTDIISKLLAFARRQSIAPSILDLNEVVDNTLKMLRRLIGEDIDLKWIPEANLWRVSMDPTQVDQVLANLLMNARDAIAGVGKITIETAKVTLDETYCANHMGSIPGEYVMLAISDDGCGMDRETLNKVFEPFFTTKVGSQGTGLGLATVYGIVKQNNGFIDVHSEPGEGTTFKIYLHRHAADEAVETREEPVSEIQQRRGETVLVAEDEILILKLTGKVLEELGYTVLLANTPNKAMRLAEEHTGEIHLIVADVIMPEMNGRDLVKQVQSIYPNLKALYMSGYSASVIARRGLLDEGVKFIQKPFSKKELADKTRIALGKEIIKEGSDS
jgi:two-component system cell cycle sensor histidine kinase/response regulator CckA